MNSIPKFIKPESSVKPIEYLVDHIDEKSLNDKHKLLLIYYNIGCNIIYSQPFIARDFFNNAIDLSKSLYGKYNPQLIQFYQKKQIIYDLLGYINDLNNCNNEILILTLLNYKFNSLETIKCLDNFRSFSLKIREKDEHTIYSNRMERILNILIKDKLIDHSDYIKLIYYYMKLLDGLTNFSYKSYTLDEFKNISLTYENLKKTDLFKEVMAYEFDINNKYLEYIYKLHFYNIKINYFFKMDKNENLFNEMNELIKSIHNTLGNSHICLIEPYLFIIKYLFKKDNKVIFEKFLLEEWCNLIDNIFTEDNLLLQGNYTLLLIKNILTRDKEYKMRLINLINLVGDNFEKVFLLSKTDSNYTESYLYGEICYYAAYLCKDEQTFSPWELAIISTEIYEEMLGGESEKYKNSMTLLEEILNQYNMK